MTQEDKLLLLKDLCARLPYGVIMSNKEWHRKPYQLTCSDVQYMMMTDDYEDVPYLRPMSSMTEEEYYGKYQKVVKIVRDAKETLHWCDTIKSIDWLNAHHFDYHRLIEKNLAIEVNESNNPYK